MFERRLKPLPLLLCALWSAGAFAAEESMVSPGAAPGEGVVSPDAAPEEMPPVEAPGLFPEGLPEGVPSMQMSTEYGSPITALGGYRPVGLESAGGIRIEPVTIRAAAQAGIGYNDNVRLSSTNKVGSLLLTMSPSLAVGLDGATQRYYAVYRGNYGIYSEASVDNFAEHNLGLNAANEWSSRLRTRFSYQYVRGLDPSGSTGTTTSEPTQWNVHAVRGAVSYGAAGAPARIEATAAHISRKYVTNRAANAIRDYDHLDFGGTFFYRVAPKTQALVEIRRADITHDVDPSLDSTEMRYLVGGTWDATAKTRGALRVGYMTKDLESATIPDVSAFTYEGHVTWMPLTYSMLDAGFRRTFNEAVEAGSSFVIDSLATVLWSHRWADRIRTITTYSYGRQEHERLSRTDTYHAVGLKATYAFQRRLRFGAEIRHDTRITPVPGGAYSRNITLLTVETSL